MIWLFIYILCSIKLTVVLKQKYLFQFSKRVIIMLNLWRKAFCRGWSMEHTRQVCLQKFIGFREEEFLNVLPILSYILKYCAAKVAILDLWSKKTCSRIIKGEWSWQLSNYFSIKLNIVLKTRVLDTYDCGAPPIPNPTQPRNINSHTKLGENALNIPK